MTTTVVVRQSDLRKYMNCQRQWALENIYEVFPLGERTMPGNKEVGTLTHAGVAAYYDDKDIDAALVQSATDMVLATGMAYEKFETALVQARLMVSRYISYVESMGLDTGWNVIDTEHRFEHKVRLPAYPDVEVLLVGTADLIVWDEITNGEYIMDHKTVGSLGQAPRPNDFQLHHYAWLRALETGRAPRGAGHNAIKRVGGKGKPPHNARFLIDISPAALDYHESAVLEGMLPRYLTDLLYGGDPERYPWNPTGECHWKCPVYDVCDLMGGGHDWRAVVHSEYNYKKGI